MHRDEVENRMQGLAGRRAEAERELREAETRLSELEDETKALQGTLALRHRAVEDLTAYERQLQQELAKVEIEEAQAAVVAAVAARDAAVVDAAKKAGELRLAHDLLERRRGELTEAVKTLRRLDPHWRRVRVPAEPAEFDEEWRSAAPLVEQELNRRLESELVAQAAGSDNPRHIESLPTHLQALARERRRNMIQERRLSR